MNYPFDNNFYSHTTFNSRIFQDVYFVQIEALKSWVDGGWFKTQWKSIFICYFSNRILKAKKQNFDVGVAKIISHVFHIDVLRY